MTRHPDRRRAASDGDPAFDRLLHHERVSAVGLNLALWVQHAAPHDPAGRA